MKKALLLSVVSLMFLFSGVSEAVLIDRGVGMIYDTDQGITWLQNANYSMTSGYDDDGKMNWSEAMEWVAQLEYGGFSDWRLPSTMPPEYGYRNDSEMGYIFYEELSLSSDQNYHDNPGFVPFTGPFMNVNPISYWSSTSTGKDGVDVAWRFDWGNGIQYQDTNISNRYAWAVRDGDYGPSVSESQSYTTDYLTLGDTFTFDYLWEIGTEPTGPNLDVLFFNGTEWETFGWALNFDGTSDQWETGSFWVPPWARGVNTRIKFSLFDLGQVTDPTVYLRNINSAPVPEPTTILLSSLGLLGMGAYIRKRRTI